MLDRATVRSIDRAAIETYGIPGLVLMENAARGLRDVILSMHEPSPAATVMIVCGSGNNGGDGYAVARHLANAGFTVRVIGVGSPAPESDAGVNRAICLRMGLQPESFDEAVGASPRFDLLVDALLGTGLTRPVRGDAARCIAWMNDAGVPIVAVDVPSGLDCDTGRPLGDAVRATVTVTFVAAKPGLVAPDAREHVGRLEVVDIGAPIHLMGNIIDRGRPGSGPAARPGERGYPA